MATTSCPACGLTSTDPDFCSECGADMAASQAQAGPRTGTAVATAQVTANRAQPGSASTGSVAAASTARSGSSQIIVNSARPGAALSVVQKRFGSGTLTGGAALTYNESASDRPCFNCGEMMRKTANFCPHCRASKESRLNGRYLFAGIVGGGGM